MKYLRFTIAFAVRDDQDMEEARSETRKTLMAACALMTPPQNYEDAEKRFKVQDYYVNRGEEVDKP